MKISKDSKLVLSSKKPLPSDEQKPDCELDWWAMEHKATFEECSKSVCKLYLFAFHSHQVKRAQATGFVVQLKSQRKVVLAPLSLVQGGKAYNFEEHPLLYASFDSGDLREEISELLKREGIQERESLKTRLSSFQVRGKGLVRLKVNKVGLAARKEWLSANSRSSELLDQEFYQQPYPSLNFCVLEQAQPSSLEGVEGVWMAPPDSRQDKFCQIGYNEPQKIGGEEFQAQYGQSVSIPQDEELILHQGKALQLGKVKVFGSVSSVVSSGCQGSVGSPCFNQLGQCWGFLSGSYKDKINQEMPNDFKKKRPHPETESLFAVEKPEKGEPEVFVKELKREKKRREKGKGEQQKPIPKLQASDQLNKRESDNRRAHFDLHSSHLLVQDSANDRCQNRNLCITFMHSGLKYVLERVQKGGRQTGRDKSEEGQALV